MLDLKDLKKKIAQVRGKSGKAHFPDRLKAQILEAADAHGSRVALEALDLSPSTLYGWQKKSLSANSGPNSKTTFIEIPRPTQGIYPSRSSDEKIMTKWEVVRPDGCVLRCELASNKIEMGSIFGAFLKGGDS